MFGDYLGSLNLDIEEARLDLIDHDTSECEHKATRALEGWAPVKHSKGEADALQVLGSLHKMEGKIDQALECYVAALCVFPYENHPNNQQLWANVYQLVFASKLDKADMVGKAVRGRYREIRASVSGSGIEGIEGIGGTDSIGGIGNTIGSTGKLYLKWLSGIEDAIASRHGYFAYLDHVAADRSSYVGRVVRRLKAYGA